MTSALLADSFSNLVPLLAQEGGDVVPGSLGYQLTAILVFSLFGIAFVVGTVSLLSRIARPSSLPEDEPAKTETYECGEPAVGSSWVRFDIRFYTVALVFLIFDVEVAFLYPWAVIFKWLRAAGMGSFVFLEMLVFITILTSGFIYCWCKGDLDWIKSTDVQKKLASKDEAAVAEASEAEASVAA